MPAGFPPIWWYELDKANESVVQGAKVPVAFTRRVDLDNSSPPWWVTGTDARAARTSWLMAFGGRATSAACTRTWTHTVNWNGAAALRRVAATDQDLITRTFSAMVRELRWRGALLADDAKAAKPNVRVVLHDLRGDTREALPQPDSLLASLLAARKAPPRVTLQ